jgi:asparagine synthase (glutamine-hydrolysing)
MTMQERYIGNAKMFTESEKAQLLNEYNDAWNYRKITQPLYENARSYDDIHKMQYVDMHTWLRGDILVKADRMTMANSLELRVPFLDKEVFKVASKITSSESVANGTTKFALREAMKGIVPDSVLYRRKLGFPVPIRHWLKNELFQWAKELIKHSPTEQYLDKKVVLDMLEMHRVGKIDYSRKIWTVLIFMIWHQIYVEKLYEFHGIRSLSDYEDVMEEYNIATS